MNDPAAHTIALCPVDVSDSTLLTPVSDAVSATFGFNCRFVSLLEDIEFAFDPQRAQYHSTPILKRLSAMAPAWALKLLAFTRRDLFIPILTYVFGEAQLGGKAAIISVSRLGDDISGHHDRSLLIERIVKEALHELGHTFKLRHCRDNDCIMHHCHCVADVDRRPKQLCRYCRVLLDDEIRRLAGRRHGHPAV